MGNTQTSASSSKQQQESETKSKRRRQKELLTRHGVLIPPTYGVGTDAALPPSSRSPLPPPTPISSSSSSNESLVMPPVEPFVVSPPAGGMIIPPVVDGTVVNSILRTTSAIRLLSTEHMTPGLWVSATTLDQNDDGFGGVSGGGGGGRRGEGNVLASYHLPPLSPAMFRSDVDGGLGMEGDGGGSSSQGGTLSMSKCFTSSSRGSPYGGVSLSASSFPRLVNNHSSSSSVGGMAFVRHDMTGLGGYVSYVRDNGGRSSVVDGAGKARIGWGYRSLISPTTTGGPDRGQTESGADVSREATAGGTGPVLLDVGSSIRLSKSRTRTTTTTGGGTTKAKPWNLDDVTDVHGHCAVRVPSLGCTAVVEMNAPLTGGRTTSSSASWLDGLDLPAASTTNRMINPEFSYLVSFDLNASLPTSNDDDASTSQAASQPSSGSGPPIVVTLHKLTNPQSQQTISAATVGQILTFDRWVLNPIESRCPKIRNTLSWSVQMCSKDTWMNNGSTTGGAAAAMADADAALTTDDETSSSASVLNRTTTTTTSLSAALAWQTNRNICYKVRASDTDGLTLAILLKRWKHPRVTLSVLFGTGGIVTSNGAASMLGIGFRGLGVQIETGPLVVGSSGKKREEDWLYGGPSSSGMDMDGQGPATKAELPPGYNDD